MQLLLLARASLLLLCAQRAVDVAAAAAALASSSTDESANASGLSHVHANAANDGAASDANMTSAVFDAPKDQALWLDRLNWLRSDGLVYSAADMAQLTWDFTLAAEARRAIASCAEQPRDVHGLHVFVDSTPHRALDASLIEDAIAAWGLHELDGLIPQLAAPQQLGDAVGKGLASRYAELVSAATTRVGCAYTICARGRLAACKYSPVSSSATFEQGWYTYGPPCSRCGATAPALSSCTAKLCSSGSSPITVTLAAHELAATAYLPHKVRSLQLALDSVVQQQQTQQTHSHTRTAVAALSTGGTNTVGTLCNGTAAATITQEQLSMLNLDGGLSPLAVVFGLFLGVSVILVMIVCIMHATKPKKRDAPQPGPQTQTPGLDKDGDDECVQVI